MTVDIFGGGRIATNRGPAHPIGFKRLSYNATFPTKVHPTDSGFDLYASEDVIIEPGEMKVVPTDIAVQFPGGITLLEAQVRPRSGITANTKLRVQLGTIDNGYTGGIGVIVDNIAEVKYGLGGELATLINGEGVRVKGIRYAPTYLIRKGDRIAQLVVQYLPEVEAIEVFGDLDETDRGSNGYGSSGVRDTEECAICGGAGEITDGYETGLCIYCDGTGVREESE